MKTFLLLISFGLTATFISCGPAAENREVMHSRAKVFQDSIALMIRMSMDEAAAPAPGTVPAAPMPADTAMKTPQPGK